MSYSSICTSFNYTGSVFKDNFYKNVPVTWREVEITCSDEWRVVGDTYPFPKSVSIRISITATNNNSYAITWNSTKPKVYWQCTNSISYDTPSLNNIDFGAWAFDKNITIAAGQTVNLSQTFSVDWTKYVSESGNMQTGYLFFLDLLANNNAGFFIGIQQSNFWQGYQRVSANFNFVYPTNIYDYRAWPHRTAYQELNESPAQYGVNITPNSYTDFNPTVTDFDNVLYASVIHSTSAATNANNPDIRIICDQMSSDPLPISYQTNYSAETYNKYVFSTGAKQRIAEYFRTNDITSTTVLTFSIQFRNPFKYNSLPIGSMIILPDNSVYEVKKTGDSSKYYQPNWQDFGVVRVPFTISPTNQANSFSISNITVDYIVDTENGGKDLGCLYSIYTKPRITFNYTAGWGIDTITTSPNGDGWQSAPTVTTTIPYSESQTSHGTITFTQPNFYTNSIFSENEIKKNVNLNLNVTPNMGTARSITRSRLVFKYIPLQINDFEGYRATSAAVRDVNGDYIGILLDYDGNPMAWSSSRHYNPIVKHLKVTTLADSQVVFDSDIDISSNVPWASTEEYELGAETSYFLELTIHDQFTSTSVNFNIGTKVAYLEFGDDARHLAIGKYCEKEGFEIQFPVFFAKQVVVLPTGAEKFREIAGIIPYEDTYNIGCTNVQQVLDWLNGRLS